MSNKNFFEYWGRDLIIDRNKLKWSLPFSLKNFPFLKDHSFDGKFLVPAAMLIDLMLEGCQQLMDKRDIYPFFIPEFEVYRKLQIDEDEEVILTLETKAFLDEQGKSMFESTLYGSLKDANGKVIRNRVRFAQSQIKLTLDESNTPDPLMLKSESGEQFTMEKEKFYKVYYTPLGNLFKTLTGDFAVASEQRYFSGDFKVADLEDRFSVATGLSFAVSPLGIDGMLQVCVGAGLTYSPEEGDLILSRIPVGCSQLTVKAPFDRDAVYRAHVRILENLPELLVCRIEIEDLSRDEIVAQAEKITLKRLPGIKYDRREFLRVV